MENHFRNLKMKTRELFSFTIFLACYFTAIVPRTGGVGASREDILALIDKRTFSELKRKADMGNHRAQMVVGLCYEHGFNVECNEVLGLKYYKLAVAGGGVTEETILGMALIKKAETINDALGHFESAAKKGGLLAAMYLAVCWMEKGIEEENEQLVEKARSILENIVIVKDAEDIIPDAFLVFGSLYHSKFMVKQNTEDVKKAVDYYLVSALRGGAIARSSLIGCYYLLDDGVNAAAWEKIVKYEGGSWIQKQRRRFAREMRRRKMIL